MEVSFKDQFPESRHHGMFAGRERAGHLIRLNVSNVSKNVAVLLGLRWPRPISLPERALSQSFPYALCARASAKYMAHSIDFHFNESNRLR